MPSPKAARSSRATRAGDSPVQHVRSRRRFVRPSQILPRCSSHATRGFSSPPSLVVLGALRHRLGACDSRRFENAVCWTLAGLLLAAEISEFGVKLFVENSPMISKLPMQLCDWALFLTVASLLWRSPRCFEVAYFWGLAGTLQGLLTPAVGQDLAALAKSGILRHPRRNRRQHSLHDLRPGPAARPRNPSGACSTGRNSISSPRKS